MAKENSDRAERLAEALRANLRRRKAQARAVEQQADAADALPQSPSGGPPAAPGGG